MSERACRARKKGGVGGGGRKRERHANAFRQAIARSRTLLVPSSGLRGSCAMPAGLLLVMSIS